MKLEKEFEIEARKLNLDETKAAFEERRLTLEEKQMAMEEEKSKLIVRRMTTEINQMESAAKFKEEKFYAKLELKKFEIQEKMKLELEFAKLKQ